MRIALLASIAAASASRFQAQELVDADLGFDNKPTVQINGYQLASERLGEVSNDPFIAAAWNALGADPKRLEALLTPSGPANNPSRAKKHSNWLKHVTSERFPHHTLRLKDPSSLGVDDVKQYSGYLDVLEEDKHFFFWMFESRNDPKNDPVVLWLNGGPGCSSSTGEFFELGPASINEDLTVTRNPYSWNNNATVIFLDQPVNVGFSYSDSRVSTSTAAGEDVYAFLEMFFESFPEYNSQDFHIAGESYGGHYLPAIGQAILHHPERNFNLSSLLIGNGITDPLNQVEASIAMQCGEGGFPAFLSEEKCAELYKDLPRCQFLIQSCYDTDSLLVCLGAQAYCERPSQAFLETGRNPYDVRDVCYDACYPEINWVEAYLNQTHVKEALGAEPIDFVGCDNQVGVDFAFKADGVRNFAPAVAEILESDVPVLLYSGDKDWICNWLGNRDWSNKFKWSHHEEFADAEVEPWYVGKKQAGTQKTAGGLTFLRVFDAGHMVPFNKPKQALSMFNEWLSGKQKL